MPIFALLIPFTGAIRPAIFTTFTIATHTITTTPYAHFLRQGCTALIPGHGAAFRVLLTHTYFRFFNGTSRRCMRIATSTVAAAAKISHRSTHKVPCRIATSWIGGAYTLHHRRVLTTRAPIVQAARPFTGAAISRTIETSLFQFAYAITTASCSTRLTST